jgi:hypothetical protein
VTVAALVVSVVALLMSGASLGWQVYSWRRSGPAVKVSVIDPGPLDQDAADDDYDHVLKLTAANNGRAPTTVKGWGFLLPGGKKLAVRTTYRSTRLPHRLEPETETSWYAICETSVQETGVSPSRITAYVTLAGGQRVKAKRGVPASAIPVSRPTLGSP